MKQEIGWSAHIIFLLTKYYQPIEFVASYICEHADMHLGTFHRALRNVSMTSIYCVTFWTAPNLVVVVRYILSDCLVAASWFSFKSNITYNHLPPYYFDFPVASHYYLIGTCCHLMYSLQILLLQSRRGLVNRYFVQLHSHAKVFISRRMQSN